MKLFLDDIRTPKEVFETNTKGWIVARSYGDFTKFVESHYNAHNKLPEIISFDHDLADVHYNPSTQTESFEYQEKTGYDCAKWLIDFMMDHNIKELPEYKVHSMNPVGRDNIVQLLENFKHYEH